MLDNIDGHIESSADDYNNHCCPDHTDHPDHIDYTDHTDHTDQGHGGRGQQRPHHMLQGQGDQVSGWEYPWWGDHQEWVFYCTVHNVLFGQYDGPVVFWL